MYQRYELDRKLLIPAYSALTFRPEPLSVKEGRQLGLETALLLAEAREYARSKPGALSPSSATLDQDQLTDVVAKVFGINLGVSAHPPEEAEDPFGLATPKLSAVASVNGTPSHSRQPSRNLSRAGSPPPHTTANGAMPSIFEAITNEANATAAAAAAAAAAEPAPSLEEKKPEPEPESEVSPPEDTSKEGGSGQAVTSSPSSVVPPLIPGSPTQEETHLQQRKLAPLQIPRVPQTNSRLEKPSDLHLLQGATPIANSNKQAAAAGKTTQTGKGRKSKKAKAALLELDNITTTTTTPVVVTPDHTSHGESNASDGKKVESDQAEIALAGEGKYDASSVRGQAKPDTQHGAPSLLDGGDVQAGASEGAQATLAELGGSGANQENVGEREDSAESQTRETPEDKDKEAGDPGVEGGTVVSQNGETLQDGHIEGGDASSTSLVDF